MSGEQYAEGNICHGAAAAGKTYFINTHYSDKDVDVLNVYDYQQRAYDEVGVGDRDSSWH